MTALVMTVVGAACCLVFQRRVRDRRAERRKQQAMSNALPEVIETIAVVVGSGGTLHTAFRVLTVSGPSVLEPSIEHLNDRVRAGVPLATAVLEWGDELGVAYRPLVGALLTAERDGAPLSQLLGRLADEAVAARRIRTEERSRALPVQLLFPVVLCALPAVIVGAVIPLILVSVGRL